jgi:hypothetical protein
MNAVATGLNRALQLDLDPQAPERARRPMTRLLAAV